MRRTIIILLLSVSFAFQADAQYNFPSLDSLRKYINRFITNSAINAFTDYRLNTALNGMLRYIDSAGGGTGTGLDSAWALNDSTIRFRKGITLFNVIIKGGRDVDSLWRDGDTLRFAIDGRAKAIYAPTASAQTIQQVINTGNTISDANDSIKVADGGTFTLHAGTGASGANLILKALQASVSHTRLVLFPAIAGLEYRDLSTGNTKSLIISSANGMTFTDQVNTTGLGYAANYRTNGLANFGARWIPDIGAVRQEISDSLSGGGGSIEAGYGLLKVSDTMKVDTAEISTRYADYNINHHNLNAQPFKLQPMQPGTLGFAADASCVRLPNGKILAIYARTGTANDFNNYVLYSATIDSLNKIEHRGALLPGGFVPEGSWINPQAYILPNGNIGLIFQGYNSGTDVQFYRTSSSDGGITWGAATQILTDSDVGHLFLAYPDRIIRLYTGRYILPFSVNTDDDPNTNTGDWVGKYMYSDDGLTWVLASTIITGTSNDCIEPGVYESYADVNYPGGDPDKMTFYWRSRQEAIQFRDSLYSGGSFSSIASMGGIKTRNDPSVIKSYRRRLYAVYNDYINNASTGQQQRNKLVFAVSNAGEAGFHTVFRLFQDTKTDTVTPFEPTLFIDTTDETVLPFYSTILTETNFGDLYVHRINNTIVSIAPQSQSPTFSNLNVISDPSASGPLYHQRMLRMFKNTLGPSDGLVAFGMEISGNATQVPLITTFPSPSSAFGSLWYAGVGTDTYASPSSAGVHLQVMNHALTGGVTNAHLFNVSNNSTYKFGITASGTIEAPDTDSTATPYNILTMKNGAIMKAAFSTGSPGGSNTQVQFNNSGSFGGSSAFTWDNANGFLGIGSGTKIAPLTIDVTTIGTSGFTAVFKDANSSNGAIIINHFAGAGSGNKTKAWSIDNDGQHWGSGNDAITSTPTRDFSIRNGGNVGVNIATPSWRFHVVGSVGFDLGSDATGDTWSRGSGGNFQRLAIGSANYMMTSTGSATQWSSPSTVAANLGLSTGFYTPTLTNTTNVSASTAYQFQWTRNDNVITFSGEIDIDPTTTATLSVLTITLPVVGSFTNSNECAGTASDDLGTSARVRATPSAGTAEIRFTPIDVTNRRFSVHGIYYYTAP